MVKHIRSMAVLLSGLTLLSNVLLANNLRIEEVAIKGNFIELDIAWDNCWNLSTGPANHDAVWLFAKIKRNGLWEHLHLAASPTAHEITALGRFEIDPDPLGKGIMLRTVQEGGHIPSTKIRIALASPILEQQFEIGVFGIEMAYVPEGPFWLGDGASNYALHDSISGQPFLVSSEMAIPAGTLGAMGNRVPQMTIQNSYPKGYAGFYLMKYELSQAQYVDFLQTLTYLQQLNHTQNPPDIVSGATVLGGFNPNRNGIVVDVSGQSLDVPASYACNADANATYNGTLDGQNRACNWISWLDLAAYLDWAALRPITEMEFEKACRGPLAPVALEFAWGTDEIVDANTILQDGAPQESVSETATGQAGLASHGYAGPQGPLRCGFGGTANSDRLQAGAGYYGHMELSGNLWEMVVSTLDFGLAFRGTHGDGLLSPDGTANEGTWPTGIEGVGFKGGGWNSGIIPGFRDLAVSDRFYINLDASLRRPTTGGRGAR